MASDPGSAATADEASAVTRLAAVLAAAAESDASTPDSGPTPRELAELLWLAQHLAPVKDGAPARSSAKAARPPHDTGDDISRNHEAPFVGPPQPEPPRGEPSPDTPHNGRVPLHVPAPATATSNGGAGGGPSLLTPVPPMLHHPLALQRALRPLKRTVPSPHARLLDERATADRIARLEARPEIWLPVLRPASDRWLRLNLVHDTGPTMPIWHPLVREMHTVLAQSGIFRTVTLHSATPDGRAHHVPDPADGRTVTLVVSDCMGPQWRPGPAGHRWYSTLRRWANRMPLAVIQPLPERLWPTTTLSAEPGLITAPAAAAPTATLSFTPYDVDTPFPPRSCLPLPVLEPGPDWLATWATLIANPGGGRTPGAVAWLPPAPTAPAEHAPDITSLPPENLVLRFRATASPEAFRLAGHLALAVPSVPVMRLVQHTLVHGPRPQHLAEVILSGMLTAVPGPPGSYAFRPGVRELLLRSLPRTAREQTREFLVQVGGLIDERAGFAAGEFRAETGSRGTAGAVFATVHEDTLPRLGGAAEEERALFAGRYRLIGPRGPGRRMWKAVDVETDRTVVVHRYPEQEVPQQRFLREARALSEIDDPYVVRVLGYGVEGETPYLVAEFVDGVTLAELQQGSGPGVPFGLFVRLATHVVTGLRALHARGLVRGQGGMDGLLLRPDGTVVISRFALGEESQGVEAAEDFRELDFLLGELAAHVTPPAHELGRLLSQIDQGLLSAEGAALQLATARDPDTWTFRMLGPLSITLSDEPQIRVPIAEAQAVLCMLLLKHGRRLTYSELASGLWEQPPEEQEAIRRIDLLASEVLRRLGPGTVAALADGYALHVPGAYVDAVHCDELLADRPDEEDPRTRRAQVGAALALWYGEPLADIPGPAAEATRARLRDLRLSLCAAGAELDMELGDSERAVTEVESLLREHPDRTDLRHLHILALKHLGRVSEAIESYDAYTDLQRQHGAPVAPLLKELSRELHRDAARRALRELVMVATVRIHRPAADSALDEPETFIGSGFFIAPSWVLTCAHVARAEEGSEVIVVYQTGPGFDRAAVAGSVAATIPEHLEEAVRGTWPAPDLALVQLRDPVDHDCVYVSERPSGYYGQDTVLYAGWTEIGGQLQILDGSLSLQGTMAESSDVYMRLGPNDFPPGVSGGPVIDPVRGEVIGVLKSRLRNRSGGLVTGIEQLRALPVPSEGLRREHSDLYQAVFHAHDRYHRDRQQHPDPNRPTWADIQQQLGTRPGRVLSPNERIQLLGRLADLPPPVSTRSLLDILESLPDLSGVIHQSAPRGWRDGLGALYEGARQDGALELVLDYAMQVMAADRPLESPDTGQAEQALWEWVRQRSERLGRSYRRRLAQRRIEQRQTQHQPEGS
ncbi:SAV_2336 N-terminal domain-related protein [Streptomyces sp. NPDC046984]|uniref:SAV_2336 N-terminal domain-related protein n=1 Tax=Streptomyces sp. NPDC046984 TaxID=3155138 RepID=UPI0033EFF882